LIIRLYQKKIGASQRSQDAAAAIKIRAEHRMGELLREMPKDPGGRPEKNRSHDESGSAPRLADLGIDRNLSSRCQAIAEVPASELEEIISDALTRLRLRPTRLVIMDHDHSE
jgi:hypothetical protein